MTLKSIFLIILCLSLISTATAAAPEIELLSQDPSVINQNSTGNFNVSFGVTHSASGLNHSTIIFTFWGYHPETGMKNASLRVPENDRAYLGIYRGDNMNSTPSINLWYNTTIFPNIYDQGGLDNKSLRMDINNINATFTYVNITATLRDTVFTTNMWYLDRTEQENATQLDQNICANNPILIKIWNPDALMGHDNYITKGFFATKEGTLPPIKSCNIYYVNSSFDPEGSVDVLDSPYTLFVGSHNITSWINYNYNVRNSSYIRGFIVNESVINASGITADGTGYIYITSETPCIKPYILNVTVDSTSTNRSFTETNTTWIGVSAPYDELLRTANVFISDRHDGHQHRQMLYAQDNDGLWNNSSIITTDIGRVEFSPTTPSIVHFHYLDEDDKDMNGTYHGTFDIGVGASTDPDGGVVIHNLTIHFANGTFVGVINGSFNATKEVHVEIEFDSVPYYSDEEYTLRLIAEDDEGETAESWLGVNFTLSGDLVVTSTVGSTWIKWEWDLINSYEIWIDGEFSHNTSGNVTILSGIEPREQHSITIFANGNIVGQNTSMSFYPFTLFLISFIVMWCLLIITILLREELFITIFGTLSFVISILNFYLTFPYYYAILSYLCLGAGIISVLWILSALFSFVAKDVEEFTS